jgi:hypothetical protein
MKVINHPSRYFSPAPATTEKKETAIQKANQSPYLKAILSGASRLINSGRIVSMVNADRDAALRYIKESALLKK